MLPGSPRVCSIIMSATAVLAVVLVALVIGFAPLVETHDENSLGEVGYFSNERGFSVESSLQRISSEFLLWKQSDLSVVLYT